MVPSGPIKLPELRRNRCEARMPTGLPSLLIRTLVLVVDPLGLVPSFISITHGLPERARRCAAFIAATMLAGSALIGDWLLRTLAISLPAFRIARGLLLFSIASEMVLGLRIERQSRQAEEALEEHVRNIAAFPLAIPLMAGPGAITATVLLAGRANGAPVKIAILLRSSRSCWCCASWCSRSQHASPASSVPPATSCSRACSA
jgi:MarC family membrane protein